MNYKNSRSFTLIELIVVMAVMGLIMGGLLVSLRQIIESENLLKKMQAVEGESRFVMDVFTQDAEYSELEADSKPDSSELEKLFNSIAFKLTEKRSEIGSSSVLESGYESYRANENGGYYLRRIRSDQNNPSDIIATTLNNIPLDSQPLFLVKKVETTDGGAENYFITVSLTFRVDVRDQKILVPVETSVMSRTFEL